MNKKMMLALLSTLLVCVLLTGCMETKGTMDIGAKGTVNTTTQIIIDKEAMLSKMNAMGAGYSGISGSAQDAMMVDSDLTLTEIDGKEYYVSKKETQKYSSIAAFYKDMDREEASAFQVCESYIRLNAGTMSDMTDDYTSAGQDDAMMQLVMANTYLNVSITFPRNVIAEKVNAGGKVDEANPKMVNWYIPMNDAAKLKEIYAYCESNITVSGVTQGYNYKNNVTLKFTGAKTAKMGNQNITSGQTFTKSGVYNIILTAEDGEQRTVYFTIDKTTPVITGATNGGLYNTTRKLTVKDDSGIASFKINNKEYADGFSNTETVTLSKTGTYKVVVKDTLGNTKTLTFKIDKKKPAIKGAKNGKTYKKTVKLRFKDANGIKKVVINGKKVKKVNKVKKLKKNGKYTVRVVDKAGNVTKIKFKIKKK